MGSDQEPVPERADHDGQEHRAGGDQHEDVAHQAASGTQGTRTRRASGAGVPIDNSWTWAKGSRRDDAAMAPCIASERPLDKGG